MKKRMLSVLCILACLTFVVVCGAEILAHKLTAGKDAADADGNHAVRQNGEDSLAGYHKKAGSKTGQGTEPEGGSAKDTETSESAGRDAGQPDNAIKDFIQKMSLEEKAAQMFVLTPEVLTSTGPVTQAGQMTKDALERYPIGGFAYFAQNIRSEQQFADMVQNAQRYSMERIGLPLFICVDEEGGSVARIAGQGIAGVPKVPDMSEVGASGDAGKAYEIGKKIGGYLKRFQVNVDFAPVADVYSNAGNTVVRKRSFGNDPYVVASMVENEVQGLKSQGIAAVLKHFPGHGDTVQDSHLQGAYSHKTMDELRACEWIPFQAGIDAGADFVMAGHISYPEALGEDTPASLSHVMLTEVLRGELGFEGIIITDALNMKSVTDRYSAAEAAVQAVLAGADMLLMPEDFQSAYQAVLDAVRDGKIKESRINESLTRIFSLKDVSSAISEEPEADFGAAGLGKDRKGGGRTVVIDAGHQSHQNSEQEPIGPGASQTKPKVSSGTAGAASGLSEYELTLQVALKLQRAFEEEGYQVVMTRTENDVDISNSERAAIANRAGADAFIRIHADGSEDPDARGAMTICPTRNNKYCGSIYESSRKLSDAVIENIAASTGSETRGVWETDTMSGINWSEVPVTILEMGFMSNREEDLLMAQESYQDLIVEGIVNGVNQYMD